MSHEYTEANLYLNWSQRAPAPLPEDVAQKLASEKHYRQTHDVSDLFPNWQAPRRASQPSADGLNTPTHTSLDKITRVHFAYQKLEDMERLKAEASATDTQPTVLEIIDPETGQPRALTVGEAKEITLGNASATINTRINSLLNSHRGQV